MCRVVLRCMGQSDADVIIGDAMGLAELGMGLDGIKWNGTERGGMGWDRIG